MFLDAVIQLFTADKLVWLNLANAMEVAGYAIIIALIISIPLGTLIGFESFPGRRIILALVHIWLFIPAIGIGASLYYAAHQSFMQPLGFIVWSSLLLIPLFTGLIANSLIDRNPQADEDLYGLGATRWQMHFAVIRDRSATVYGALAVGIARIFTEIAAFFLVISFIFHQGFPSKPVFDLPTASAHLAVAIGLFIIGSLVYLGIHVFQFRRGQLS
ncbi:MAG: hypothetical protein MAGBODY4_00890 [Candidatus Marinimicrobia bacterium]|nr:hypothetical protein [Candidatus Neomarinimicrobiota bacterium]